MDKDEYESALEQKARDLYLVLLMDPLPIYHPRCRTLYPPTIEFPEQYEFWTDLVRDLQIIKFK